MHLGEQESPEEGQHFTFISHKRELLKMTKAPYGQMPPELMKFQRYDDYIGMLTHGLVILNMLNC